MNVANNQMTDQDDKALLWEVGNKSKAISTSALKKNIDILLSLVLVQKIVMT